MKGNICGLCLWPLKKKKNWAWKLNATLLQWYAATNRPASWQGIIHQRADLLPWPPNFQALAQPSSACIILFFVSVSVHTGWLAVWFASPAAPSHVRRAGFHHSLPVAQAVNSVRELENIQWEVGMGGEEEKETQEWGVGGLGSV